MIGFIKINGVVNAIRLPKIIKVVSVNMLDKIIGMDNVIGTCMSVFILVTCLLGSSLNVCMMMTY